MAKLGLIADPQRVPEWVATCPTCGGPVECGIEEWESETGIVTAGGLVVECAADDHEGAVEWQTGDWYPVRERVQAWARLALRVGADGLRPATSREVWRVMAETSAIRKGLTPWGSLSATRFMTEAAGHTPTADVATETFATRAVLCVSHRPQVATGKWWEMWWVGEDGARHDVAASSLALLMERAAAVELGVRDEAEREWGEGVTPAAVPGGGGRAAFSEVDREVEARARREAADKPYQRPVE